VWISSQSGCNWRHCSFLQYRIIFKRKNHELSAASSVSSCMNLNPGPEEIQQHTASSTKCNRVNEWWSQNSETAPCPSKAPAFSHSPTPLLPYVNFTEHTKY
jgi:hypothetical protein